MNHIFKEGTASVNHIEIHYIQYANDKPKLLLLHGLTANAYVFNGLIKAGLTEHFSVISMDQRGRGLSSKPAFEYGIHDHARDVIGLLDYLKIEKLMIAGHSFGGLMAAYLAYHYPERFEKVIILDAAPQMNPNAPEMLAATIGRLDKHYKSFDDFIEEVKDAPYLPFWDDAMMAYYKADVATAEDESVEPRSNLSAITQIAIAVSEEDWTNCFESFTQASLLIVATDDYTLNQPLLPVYKAKEILKKMKHCKYIQVSGNHQTMLYGKGAKEIVKAISEA